MNAKKSLSLVVATSLVVVVVVALCWQPVLAQRGTTVAGSAGGGASPRYSVIDTEGHNLIVTDNQTNTLYYYTTLLLHDRQGRQDRFGDETARQYRPDASGQAGDQAEGRRSCEVNRCQPGRVHVRCAPATLAKEVKQCHASSC
jgi:hypothetical protein